MLQAMKYRLKKLLGLPLPPKPYEVVRHQDALLSGCFRRETNELCQGFRITSEDVVVDVGCGDGSATLFAAHCGAAKVIATDIDADQIEKVRRRVAEDVPGSVFESHVSDSTPLPLASGIATKVICQEVLEHVEEPAAVLAELVRIGKPDAQYLFAVPDPLGEAIQKHVAPPSYWQRPNHLRVFEREQFYRLVGDAGLIVEKRTSQGFFWAMWWALFWADVRITPFGGPGSPVLRHWNKTWQALIDSPQGDRVRQALNDTMPKSQIILARKAA